MFDVLIKNGRIVDGSGEASYVADIGITGDRIYAIGRLSDASAKDELDASGLLVLPGFIDTHLHSDMALLYDRQHANALCQGITTEILGQDGLSYAPLSKDNLLAYAKYLAGLNGYFEDVPLDFTSVAEYLARFHKKAAVNVAYQVPHGTIRLEALGFNDKPLTGYALEKAKDLMRQGFEDGAVAFSTGLSYYPCSFSDTEELVRLCEVCAEYDVPFVTHTRSVFRDKPFDPDLESIEIARRAGCKLHFSHFRTGPANAGKTDRLLAPMEKVMAQGMDITFETYPYYSGSGYVVIFLPLWAVEGGYQATLGRLADPGQRTAIVEGINANTFPPEGTFTHLKKNEQYVGMDFKAVAEERGQSVGDMLCDILLEEDLEVGYYSNPTGDEFIRRQMDRDFVDLISRPYYMVCTDAISIGLKPHPRSFGTFPRFLRLCREQGLSYEVFANRASAVPARTFRLQDRGRIQKEYFADLVVIDGETVTDHATYQDPRRAPSGIKHVIVNGQIAVYNEKVTGLLAGYALQRG